MRSQPRLHDPPMRALLPNLPPHRHQQPLPRRPKPPTRLRPQRLRRHVPSHRRRTLRPVRPRPPSPPTTRRKRRALDRHLRQLSDRRRVRPAREARTRHEVRAVHGRGRAELRRDLRRARLLRPDQRERLVQGGVREGSRQRGGDGADKERHHGAGGKFREPADTEVYGGTVLRAAPRLHRPSGGDAVRAEDTHVLPVSVGRGGGRGDRIYRSGNGDTAQEGQGSALALGSGQ
mmetsp:Transcript_3890/g.7395  ORF Transcript_3890/g.7395 Transcript_3890/m.7395 type:complete len:233 (+) Transcript_3890:596-1294(+)